MNLAFTVPPLAATTATGVIIDVATAGIEDPLGSGAPFFRLTDGTAYPVPNALRDWAMSLLAAHQQQPSDAERSIFPCQIEFGIREGRMYAELM